MWKNKFVTSTLILILGGAITRIFGFFIKIIYTRMIGPTGVSLYALIMPTYSLLITIASLSLPLSISKLVAENKTRSKKILFSGTLMILALNVLLIIAMFFLSKPISHILLKNKDTYYLLMAMTLTLPFISISSICKGYFFGKQNMVPNTISNILEQLIKIILIVTILPSLVKKSILLAVIALILFNIVTEITSIVTFLCFAPKKWTIKKEDLVGSTQTMKEICSISLPTVSSRFIGNIGFFLEPIIITNVLLKVGFSSEYILEQYGAYNAYTIALLTMPSFFIGAVCSSLVPEISKMVANQKVKMMKRRFYQALFFCLIIGLTSSMTIYFYREELLQVIYKTNLGCDYIRVLAPFFVLFYLEAPLSSTLQALGMAKETMKITLLGEIIKLFTLTTLCFCKMGIYSLVYAEIMNIILVVFLNAKKIKKIFTSS